MATNSARLLRHPIFKAAAAPMFLLNRLTKTRGSPLAAACTAAVVASLEPSSTTMSSQSAKVWASTLATARAIVPAA
jgi:hypothetical protein